MVRQKSCILLQLVQLGACLSGEFKRWLLLHGLLFLPRVFNKRFCRYVDACIRFGAGTGESLRLGIWDTLSICMRLTAQRQAFLKKNGERARVRVKARAR